MTATILKPLIGIAVQLAISWLVVWLIERKNLSVLGLYPTRKRIKGFLVFFLLTAFCCATGFFMRMLFAHEQWTLNPLVSGLLIVKGTWWMLTSVVYEELIFRGVLLFILIKRIGQVRAIIFSSIAFGIYHWFSHNIIGNIPQMTFTFISTGIFGLVLAYAYAKTFSLYIPVAIHLGWNLTHGFLFSQGSIGNGVFIPVASQPEINISYFVFYSILVLPMLLAMGINFFLLKRLKPVAHL